MDRKTYNLSSKGHDLFIILRSLYNRNPASISNACLLMELLGRYGMADGHINLESYEIFGDRELRKAFDEFVLHNLLYLRLPKSITITQHVSFSYLEDLNAIYQLLLKNIKNIVYFQDKFYIEVSLEIHLKGFDAGKALAIANLILNSDIDYLSFIFEFPVLDKGIASCLISNLKQFSSNSVLKDTRIRLINFPFCFIPPAAYKCLYRHRVNPLKRKIFFQQDTIRRLQNKKFPYLQPCKTCRCRVPCYTYTAIHEFPDYAPFLSPRAQKTIAFVGGSLNKEDYLQNEDIVYTTPAEQGDMLMTILEGFENILIIDGYFYSKFPCTTFEVMLALECGINVFGSSSIGALRAVELDNYGMTGIGYVYNYLKKQPIKPYHIVAQTYNEQDMPLTIPLVDIIYFLDSALSEKIISKGEFNNCLSIADNIHFTLFSFKSFFNQLKAERKVSLETIEKLENYLSSKGKESFNIKKKDVLQLLNEFRGILNNRNKDYVQKTYHQAKDKYLKILYNKYRCNYDLTLPKDWKFSPSRKKTTRGCNTRDNREYSAEKTCQLAKEFFEGLDIIIADTTKYDAGGSFIINIFFIPFYFLGYFLSSSTGNGDVFSEALASAYMELVERIPMYEFNINSLPADKLSKEPFPHKDLPQYYNWNRSSRYKNKRFTDSGYVEATDILSSRDIFISRDVALSRGSCSDGNASGNSLAEAVLYGIYELIERDTSNIYVYDPSCYKLQSKLLIDKREIKDKRCQALLEQFEAKGYKIMLLNLHNIYNIPCVSCVVYDSNHKIMRHGSIAARSDFYSAVYAALHEAYMLYIIYFVGTRDDYQPYFNKQMHIQYKIGQEMLLKEQGFIETIPYPLRFSSITEELEYIISKLANADIRHIIVANTSPNNEYTLKSLKVIIPGLDLLVTESFTPSPFFYKKVKRTIQYIFCCR